MIMTLCFVCLTPYLGRKESIETEPDVRRPRLVGYVWSEYFEIASRAVTYFIYIVWKILGTLLKVH